MSKAKAQRLARRDKRKIVALELDELATCKDYLQVRSEERREVSSSANGPRLD